MQRRTDFLVIGSGIAGLSFALEAAEHGQVTVLAKKRLDETNTSYAQGGIAAAVDRDDSPATHERDTLACGAGLNREDTVRFLVESGPEAVRRLEDWGVRFSRAAEGGSTPWDLGREGGHTQRRVLHAGDFTGKEIERALLAQAAAHANITLVEQSLAIDLVTASRLERSAHRGRNVCYGAHVLDAATGEVATYAARAVVLATGGAGKVYLYTTNPDVATGDGVAMALRAGCRVANMEFFQFHPTCLYHPKAKSFLISEALRGEGGTLRLGDGAAFMERYHAMRDLAPRDVVAHAIDHEMKASGADCVFLDMTHLKADFLRERFPNIHERCLSYGIDMTREPIPVVPAAHYQCGGVMTDLAGRSDVERLYAVGEVASTGVHGGNRLASNSLLEGVVFGRAAARDAARLMKDSVSIPPLPEWDSRGMRPSDESVVISHTWDEIRRLMWNYVGIVRSTARLERAGRRLALIRDEI